MSTNTALSEITAAWDALGCAWREAEVEDAVEGVQPKLVCEPEHVEQAAAALAACNERKLAVLPRGSGTKLGLGNPPRAGDVIFETRKLNRVLDYMPDNLTITVEAGITLAAVQQVLDAERQLLPVDPPYAYQATIGGIVATNSSGPSRLLYGAMRDLIVGSQVALPDGRLARSGGRVVKNVAGYDLNKLWTGSLGTLSLFTEFTFKLVPVPETEGTLLASFDGSEAIAGQISAIVRSIYGPAALDILDDRAAQIMAKQLGKPALAPPGSGTVLAARGRGLRPVVERQMRGLGEMAGKAGATGIAVLDAESSARFWSTLAGYRSLVPETVVLKLAMTLTQLEPAFALIRRLLEENELSASLVAHAGSGIIYLHIEPPASDDRVVAVVRRLRESFGSTNSSAVIERAPFSLKQQIDVWGEPGGGLRMMQALKSQFDPNNIMNPGRYVAGI